MSTSQSPKAGGTPPGSDSEPLDPKQATTRVKEPIAGDGTGSTSTQQRIEDQVRQRLFRGPIAAHRIGRFIVLDEIGRGGMGTVYAAYDEQLDRKVAVKVLPDDEWSTPGARLRFQREAQAMARLSHPNVATVHEVGESDGVVFLAMEFIDGQTLASWVRTRPEWRDVVEAYAQAGRGLAAAHEAGLVHRDLKPHNIMRSDHGEVKVLDFGLARAIDGTAESETSTAELSASSSHALLASSVTRVGTVMGTPAYMSPEQLRGDDVGPRSDQFSFCVALYEGLYGERPFDDPVLKEPDSRAPTRRRSRDTAAAQLTPKDGKVPTAVRKVLQRGLRLDPQQRWPSMDALVEALEAQIAPRRQGWLGATVVVGLLGLVVGIGLDHASAPERPCQDARRRLDEIWDEARARAVREAVVGTGLSYATDTWARLEMRLDDYADAWARAHTEACEATAIRREQSEATLDLRMACLNEQRTYLRAVVDELSRGGAAAVENAIHTVISLPSPSKCEDVEALRAEVPPPDDPAVAERVAALEERLVEAAVKEQSGEYEAGFAVAEEVVAEARMLGYEPLQVRAGLLHDTLRQRRADYEGIIESLEGSYTLALRHRMLEDAAQAATMQMDLLGGPLAKHEDARRWLVHAEPLSLAAGTDEARLAYLDGLGQLAREEGKLEESRSALEQAVATTERAYGPEHPALASKLDHLGIVLRSQGEFDRAEQLHRRALIIIEQALGPDHPRAALALRSLGITAYDAGRLTEAREHYRRALEIFERAVGSEHPEIATTLVNVGNVAQHQGEFSEARDAFERALAIQRTTLGPNHLQVAYALNNLGLVAYRQGELDDARDYHQRSLDILESALPPGHHHLGIPLVGLGNAAKLQGELDEARAYQERAVAIFDEALGPEHPNLAHPLTSIGNLLLEQDRPAEAIAPLERALSIRTEHGVDPSVTAETRYALARALWDGSADEGRDRDRARELAEQARSIWADDGKGRARFLERAETWLREHGGLDETTSSPSAE